MDRQDVESSSIKSVGYDPDEHVLEISFEDSGVYRYFGVLPGVHERLMAALSHGQFFQEEIRDRYEYEQVDETDR